MLKALTVGEALDRVKGLTLANRWRIEPRHGLPRMRQRGASFEDVRHGLIFAGDCHFQDNGRWKLETEDLDGDEMSLVVVVEDDVLVVTLF
jgi:hypothetical protein